MAFFPIVLIVLGLGHFEADEAAPLLIGGTIGALMVNGLVALGRYYGQTRPQ